MRNFSMEIPGRGGNHIIHSVLYENLFYLMYYLFFPTGGGITDRNLQRILEGSGATEFHCSARSARDSGMKFR